MCFYFCRVWYWPLYIFLRCGVRHRLLAMMTLAIFQPCMYYYPCIFRRSPLTSSPPRGECLASTRRPSSFYCRRSRCLLVFVFIECAVLDRFLFCLVLGNRLDYLSLLVSWFYMWGLLAHGGCHYQTPFCHGCYDVPTVTCSSSTFLSP
jgi:hypothetical protein